MPSIWTLLPYLLVAYGLCFVLQQKALFLQSKAYLDTGEPQRLLDRMLDCSFCTGFHCGWVVWFLCWGITGTPPGSGGVLPVGLSILSWGLASAVFCLVVDTYTAGGIMMGTRQ